MVIGEKDRKLLRANIPFWHPESFVVSADRRKRDVFIYCFSGRKPCQGLHSTNLSHCCHRTGTTWSSLMSNRVFSSPIGI